MPHALSTIADHIRYAFSCFNAEHLYFGHGYDNAWDEAVQLVLQSLSLPWDFSQELWHCRVTSEEQVMLLERIDKRVNDRIPLAYLTHQAWFCGMPFYVDERVLVPRSPIAELIEQHLEPWLTVAPDRILDVCTGSGCIGIAAAMAFEHAHVTLLDISEDALDVAQRNIDDYALQDRVQAIRSDGCSALLGQDQKYQLILCNPPYVDAQDMASMPAEYHHEPRLGLEAGEDGLDLVHRLLVEARALIDEEGLLVLEVGNSWKALESAYPGTAFTWVEFERGGHGVFVMSARELKAMPLKETNSNTSNLR